KRSPTNNLAPIAPGQREVTQPEAGQATTPTKKSDKGSTGSAGAAGGTTRPAGPSKGSAGPGGSAPPASPGNPGTTPATRPPTPPPGGGPSANLGQPKQLTAGGGNYKDATYSSVTTGPISPVAGGRIFVWVIGLIGNDDPAPIPSASGLGLSFTEVATITKKEDAPRRLTVLSAV